MFQIVVINYSSFVSSQTCFEYYMPKAYTGLVKINYEIVEAEEILEIQTTFGKRYVMVIPYSGILDIKYAIQVKRHYIIRRLMS